MGLELGEVDGHCVECRGDESGERADIDLKFYGDREHGLGQADEIYGNQTCSWPCRCMLREGIFPAVYSLMHRAWLMGTALLHGRRCCNYTAWDE